MPVELWNEARNTPQPALRFRVVSPGTDIVKTLAIKNTNNKIAKTVRVGAVATSQLFGGGNLLLTSGWLFGRKFGDQAWIPLTADLLIDSILLGDLQPSEIGYAEMRVSIPSPKVIRVDEKCVSGPVTIYDFDLPPEFILKLMILQL